MEYYRIHENAKIFGGKHLPLNFNDRQLPLENKKNVEKILALLVLKIKRGVLGCVRNWPVCALNRKKNGKMQRSDYHKK